MKSLLTLAGVAGLAGVTQAADLHVDIEIPRLTVAEYHKPYLAIWVARPDQSVAANLGVWYQLTDGPEGEGATWLKDIRQWWRRTGRNLDLPLDGITAPTRGPGKHELTFSGNASPLAELPEGDYILHVEASREVGGRELLRIPFEWGAQSYEKSVSGSRELGTVSIKLATD